MQQAPPTTAQKLGRIRQGAVWGVFALTVAGMAAVRSAHVLGLPVLDMPLGPNNPDTWLRLTQVRQWLSGSDFFDHGVRHTNAPYGGITTPWTRPMDALLALFYFLTPHGLAVNLRLMLAGAWLPPLLCAIAAISMAKAARHYFNHFQVLFAAIVLMLCNAYRVDYFSPGDADHHGLLSALWCGVLCLVTIENPSRRIALAAGALLGAMVWVSPEGLVPMAAIYALLGFEALLKPERMTKVFLTAAGAALAATAALCVERPMTAITQDLYDTLSIVHVVLLWLTAAGAGFLTLNYQRKWPLSARAGAVAAAGTGLFAAMWALYPKFFQGALVDADPFILTGFLPNVTEIRPLWQFPWTEILREMAQPLLATALVLITARRGFGRLRPGKRRFILLMSALLAITAALAVWEVRWEYYLQPVAIILSAALLPGIAMSARLPFKRTLPRFFRPVVWIAAVFALTKITSAAATDLNPYLLQEIACNDEIRYVIQTGQVQKLFGDRDMTLFVPANAGGDVLFFTPYSIIASNYHREGMGLRDIHDLESAEFGEKSFTVLTKRHVTGMLYCPSYYPERAWLFKIGNEAQRPDWLTPAKNLRFFERKGTYIPKPVLFRVEN